MRTRRHTHLATETSVLTQSARRCCLCYYLDGGLAEKLGQIARLDRNRANSEEDNLAFLCLYHHSIYDSATSQHKNYTAHEVKRARAKLYETIRSWSQQHTRATRNSRHTGGPANESSQPPTVKQRWFERWPQKLENEKHLIQKTCPALRLEERTDGTLAWVGV